MPLMKIIFLKRDKLGDLLLTTPALQLLKQILPDIKLTVVAPESSGWILKDAPFIDQLYIYPQHKSFTLKSVISLFTLALIFLRIRREGYDFAVAAGGEYSHRAVKRLLWMGAKRTISFVPKNTIVSGITDPIILLMHKKSNLHESHRIIRLLDPIIQSQKKIKLQQVWFDPPQEWLREAKEFLLKHNLKIKEYIVFGLGARREKKQASKEQIIATAEYVHRKYKFKTILVWTPGNKKNKAYPGDDELASEILKDAPQVVIPLRAPLNLTIGVIWLSRKSIFPDSGLMHFAAASPGGVIGLFADTKISPSPQQWGPLGEESDYIEANKTIKELGNNFLFKKLNRL
jgi:heptosyltransferase-3